MRCSKCNKKAVIRTHDGPLCKEHFFEYFERNVFRSIEEYDMLKNVKKAAVAVSGGKDSTVTLYLVNKYIKEHNLSITLEAICIDEGIKGYREITIRDLRRITSELKIPLKIISFKEFFGYTLDEMLKKLNVKACRLCGVFRRYLLNKFSKEYDILFTGHNLDDELQTFLMNIFNSNTQLISRQGPVTGLIHPKGFTKRVKPLFYCREKEVFIYALLKGFNITFTECPYASSSFRDDVRAFLNELEEEDFHIKYDLLSSFFEILPLYKGEEPKESIKTCKICGEPSSQDVCRACYFRSLLS